MKKSSLLVTMGAFKLNQKQGKTGPTFLLDYLAEVDHSWRSHDPRARECCGRESTISCVRDGVEAGESREFLFRRLGLWAWRERWLFHSFSNILCYSCDPQGYLCLPYMALQQHHLLSDVTVRGFVAGATNILFRQQKHLSDAIVEVGLCVSACSCHCWSLFPFLECS